MAELKVIVIENGIARVDNISGALTGLLTGEIVAGGYESSMPNPFWATFKSDIGLEISLFFNDTETHDFLHNAFMQNNKVELWNN